MPVIEGLVDPEVWTTKGPLKLNERVEVSAEEAAFLIEREQAILAEDGDVDIPEPPAEPDLLDTEEETN